MLCNLCCLKTRLRLLGNKYQQHSSQQRSLLCTLTSGMRPLCRFVTRTIRSQSITGQLEQSTHTVLNPGAPSTEPFCLLIVSIPRTYVTYLFSEWRINRRHGRHQSSSIYFLLSNSCKTRRNTAKDEQKYQPIFLLVFSGSCVTKSQVY